MRFLTYSGLELGKLERSFDKVRAAIERDDFRSAEVKKLQVDGYYRAKLDDTNRLLLKFVSYAGERSCLALELIRNHAYDKSRFLRGARFDADKIELPAEVEPGALDASPVRYVHPERPRIEILDKPISFDDTQDAVLRAPTPVLLVGSAGSGKTAVALCKLREATGDVAYVTQSAYLAENARRIYRCYEFEREEQEAVFLSQRELLESIRVPAGRPVTFGDFRGFFERMRREYRFAGAHQVFEEFRGVLTSRPEGPLGLAEYQGLGVKQSIFSEGERVQIHALLGKYREWLQTAGLYEPNLVAHEYLAHATPRFDFVVVDEVQDLTNVELALILRMLRSPSQFVLCGDSNQIVHPNFFSWGAVKSHFWKAEALDTAGALSVIDVNYRNALAITELANALLKVKHARFGSIDKESNQLVRPVAEEPGHVVGLAAKGSVIAELNGKTRRSTQFAVIVLRDEDKAEAKQHFDTPLVFSVHEAKGLEYTNVILYSMISSARQQFATIAEGVTRADLAVSDLRYSRARDKSDKSVEVYKFFINALYVAVTRATGAVYLVESDQEHPLLRLLSVAFSENSGRVAASESSKEEWQAEARKLELQGKTEQADAIRQGLLRQVPVPWEVVDAEVYERASRALFEPGSPERERRSMFELAAFHQDRVLYQKIQQVLGYRCKEQIEAHHDKIFKSERAPYSGRNFKSVLDLVERHGVELRTAANLTPLMLAAASGNPDLVDALLARGASLTATDHFGRMPMHFALEQALANPHFARFGIGRVWDRLTPGTIDLQVDGRLVKLARHQGEYLLFALITLAHKRLYGSRFGRIGVIAATDLAELAETLPDVVAPEFRRKRTYLSSLLSKNEAESKDPHSRRFLQRESRGSYLPHQELCIRATPRGGEPDWVPIFTHLGRRTLELHTVRVHDDWEKHPNWVRAREPGVSPAHPAAPSPNSWGFGPGLWGPEPEAPAKPKPIWRSSSKKRRR